MDKESEPLMGHLHLQCVDPSVLSVRPPCLCLSAMAPKKKEEPKPAPAAPKPPEPERPKTPVFDPATVTVKDNNVLLRFNHRRLKESLTGYETYTVLNGW